MVPENELNSEAQITEAKVINSILIVSRNDHSYEEQSHRNQISSGLRN